MSPLRVSALRLGVHIWGSTVRIEGLIVYICTVEGFHLGVLRGPILRLAVHICIEGSTLKLGVHI